MLQKKKKKGEVIASVFLKYMVVYMYGFSVYGIELVVEIGYIIEFV